MKYSVLTALLSVSQAAEAAAAAPPVSQEVLDIEKDVMAVLEPEVHEYIEHLVDVRVQELVKEKAADDLKNKAMHEAEAKADWQKLKIYEKLQSVL